MASTPFTFRAIRTGDISAAFVVGWTVVGTGTNPATVGDFEGYTGMPSGSVSFGAGDNTPKTITVNVLQDTITEPDKTFDVVLGVPTGGVQVMPTKARAPGTIRNDD